MTRIAPRPPPSPSSLTSTRLIGEGQIGPNAASATANPTGTPGGSGTGAAGAAAAQSTEPSAFARMIGSLGQETSRGEATMKSALSAHGSELGTADLLALQAGVYRYGEVVDLASRLVDRATSNVKTVLQGSS